MRVRLESGCLAGVLGWTRKQATLYFSLVQKPSDVASMYVLCSLRALAETTLYKSKVIDLQNSLNNTAQAWIWDHTNLNLSFYQVSLNKGLVSISLTQVHSFLLAFLKAII